MNKNDLFSNKQYRYLPKRFTALQLLNIIDEWSQAVDEGYAVNCLHLDFMKAFDTVPYQRLLRKLESYGITDRLLSWIRDFLSNLVQRVIMNGTPSSWSDVLSGIPQDSVLGPLLFLYSKMIYVNH